MIVITKGEAGGAQSHVLALCQALQTRVKFTVVIGGPVEDSVLGRDARTWHHRVPHARHGGVAQPDQALARRATAARA